ncbi:MAG: hypothetical protein D6B28_08480 [Gammaproteobacteria bacterium]|nr:MAG: hypothetical protein D6B28_08480 [Gammaproteobacteria bacterium]
MEESQNKRKNYLINKNFQFHYIAILILLQITVASCVGFVVSYIFLIVYSGSAGTSSEDTMLLITWAVLVLICGGVFCAWAIKYTNRIAGPIFHIRKLLQAAAEGNIPRDEVKFRTNDHFKDLEQDLTSCFRKMQEYKDKAEA